ncbi:MAG TPA: DUF4159 domain-containing protein [Candidatus Acidoferrales bacterium]|nr:DUF4159 domain-containing protein [Candidatus Acidoferrales bacterium]
MTTHRTFLGLAAVFLFALPAPQQGVDQNGMIEMDGQFFAPPDPREKAEWTFARLEYNLGYQYGRFGFRRWAADWPKADRQFIRGVRRLTRIEARSTETIVDLDSDDLYNWPWIYVEDAGGWRISEKQAARLREYLLRGGFLMADDSHGDYEWEVLVGGLRQVFPDRRIEDLPNNDEIFKVAYDLNDRVQIPGTCYIWGYRWEVTPDSATPEWRGIRDDKGRLMVAICHNSDVGDAWEWADSPDYPEHEASVAYRIGVNYIIYGMTH